jgi:hypothetical protein
MRMAGNARKVLHFPRVRSNLSFYPYLPADAVRGFSKKRCAEAVDGKNVSPYGAL